MTLLPNGTAKYEGADEHSRFWAMLGCPRCAGAVMVEFTGPYEVNFCIRQVPIDSNDFLKVGHLPEDVARYFNDAVRVLQAGVPDAAAVQLL